ncbi:hypothetical protein [uncultured Roseobacter sp.]|uniref:hypothetical protein n=1 Tax=uncultured Roseobacter sp. TaxID=114847 RepID=UPI002622421A|nr:hypothetical protein [uncultured Roseobacter sp.]
MPEPKFHNMTAAETAAMMNGRTKMVHDILMAAEASAREHDLPAHIAVTALGDASASFGAAVAMEASKEDKNPPIAAEGMLEYLIAGFRRSFRSRVKHMLKAGGFTH